MREETLDDKAFGTHTPSSVPSGYQKGAVWLRPADPQGGQYYSCQCAHMPAPGIGTQGPFPGTPGHLVAM